MTDHHTVTLWRLSIVSLPQNCPRILRNVISTLEKYYQHFGEILSAFTGNHRFTPWHNFNPFKISNVTSCIKNLVHKSIGATYLFLKAAIFDTVSWSNDQCVLRGEPQQVWCKWGNSLTGEHTKCHKRNPQKYISINYLIKGITT